MKKNIFMRLACVVLVLTLLSTCVISGTFAKYVTTAVGEDTARVAKFGVVVTAESDIFAPEYDEDVNPKTGTVSVKADDTADVVAPGTTGTMTAFTIAGAPEVDVMVEITLAKVDPISMVKLPAGEYLDWTTAATADEYTLANDYYPVVWSLKQDGVEKATGNLADIQYYLTNTLSKKYEVEADTFDTINGDWTLDWAWAFEGDEDDGVTLSTNPGTTAGTADFTAAIVDSADTSLGQAAVTGVDTEVEAVAVLNETFDFAITVTQVD